MVKLERWEKASTLQFLGVLARKARDLESAYREEKKFYCEILEKDVYEYEDLLKEVWFALKDADHAIKGDWTAGGAED